jgi:hypothetical protein
VDYLTQPDTATEGDDYVGASGTVTFADGVSEQEIVIMLVEDTTDQLTEFFKITIDNPTGASLGAPRTATVILFGDELPRYNDFSSIAGLQLNRNALQVGNILQLTSDDSEQAGSALFNSTISLAANASFRSVFTFQLIGGSGGSDGFTFVFHNDPRGPIAVGAPGSGLGYDGIANAVAIKFDTYRNGLEINDNHISIVEGSIWNQIATGIPELDLNSGVILYAWVDYNGESKSLSVYLSGTPEKPMFLLVEATINLEQSVGSEAYFGFTAATGGLTNEHQILSWQLDQIPPPEEPPKDPTLRPTPVNLISGFSQPTSLAWIPGGPMLIAEKSGSIRVAAEGVLDSTPFYDIAPIVNDVADRGLLDIAVHPKFLEGNPYVYVLYTYEGVDVVAEQADTLGGPNGRGNRAGRLVRITADASNDYKTAVAGSEEILLGKNSIRDYFNPFVDSTVNFDEPPRCIENGEEVQDCIVSDSFVAFDRRISIQRGWFCSLCFHW